MTEATEMPVSTTATKGDMSLTTVFPHPVPLTAEIVSAFVAHNAVPAAALPELIRSVHGAIVGLGAPTKEPKPAAPLVPAVPIKKSVTDDYLVCLDNGLKFKSLKRHLSTLGMTPADYRAKWGLPSDYPMAAPAYAAKRSDLAKGIGLGHKPPMQAEAA